MQHIGLASFVATVACTLLVSPLFEFAVASRSNSVVFGDKTPKHPTRREIFLEEAESQEGSASAQSSETQGQRQSSSSEESQEAGGDMAESYAHRRREVSKPLRRNAREVKCWLGSGLCRLHCMKYFCTTGQCSHIGGVCNCYNCPFGLGGRFPGYKNVLRECQIWSQRRGLKV